ncbi:MAG: cysteine--tRNA ligase [Cystobacterineae bacterium]|nr:cysteine--tRNA ligase [Cystobacterineae bacterium]
MIEPMPIAPIRVFNTMSQSKEEFKPLRASQVSIYVCGPTVYDFIHIGNARTFTVFDTVVRFLSFVGYEVNYVRNYTDVDDKIIQAAMRMGERPLALAERFIEAFEEDAAHLKLLVPRVAPRVSMHMEEIIEMVGVLEAKGFAYASGGDVYFSVSSYPGYAELSKRELKEMRAGERIAVTEQKREPLDFALWKAAKPGEPSWPSPWGPGRPGWHIECSAMSAKYLGETFDIHGGGGDLIFPHHENELAQSQAASGKPLCNYWMHCGFLDLAGAKMSKSLGNTIGLRDALSRVDADSLRFFFLSTHYRNPLKFSDKSLGDAQARIGYFYESLQLLETLALPPTTEEPKAERPYLEEFQTAMCDDFNTASALAVLSELFNEVNLLGRKHLPHKANAKTWARLSHLRSQAKAMGKILGLFEEEPSVWLDRRKQALIAARKVDVLKIEELVALRQKAREAKDFAQADVLRRELGELGVELRDTPKGPEWKLV